MITIAFTYLLGYYLLANFSANFDYCIHCVILVIKYRITIAQVCLILCSWMQKRVCVLLNPCFRPLRMYIHTWNCVPMSCAVCLSNICRQFIRIVIWFGLQYYFRFFNLTLAYLVLYCLFSFQQWFYEHLLLKLFYLSHTEGFSSSHLTTTFYRS